MNQTFRCRLGESFTDPAAFESRFIASYSFLDQSILAKPASGKIEIADDYDRDKDTAVQLVTFSRPVAATGVTKYYRGKVSRESQLQCVFLWDPAAQEFVIEKAPAVACHPADAPKLIRQQPAQSKQAELPGGAPRTTGRMIKLNQSAETKRQRTSTPTTTRASKPRSTETKRARVQSTSLNTPSQSSISSQISSSQISSSSSSSSTLLHSTNNPSVTAVSQTAVKNPPSSSSQPSQSKPRKPRKGPVSALSDLLETEKDILPDISDQSESGSESGTESEDESTSYSDPD